jgi:hypothetical protein
VQFSAFASPPLPTTILSRRFRLSHNKLFLLNTFFDEINGLRRLEYLGSPLLLNLCVLVGRILAAGSVVKSLKSLRPWRLCGEIQVSVPSSPPYFKFVVKKPAMKITMGIRNAAMN